MLKVQSVCKMGALNITMRHIYKLPLPKVIYSTYMRLPRKSRYHILAYLTSPISNRHIRPLCGSTLARYKTWWRRKRRGVGTPVVRHILYWPCGFLSLINCSGARDIFLHAVIPPEQGFQILHVRRYVYTGDQITCINWLVS